MGDWTATPTTWTAGDVPTAAGLNQYRDFANGFGAWTSYTPTLTGFTLGSGTVSGAYCRVQKFLALRFLFTFGSGSAAASAAPTFSLPSGMTISTGIPTLTQVGWGTFFDTGTATYSAIPRVVSTSTIGLYISGTNGIHTTPSTTSPFTWTTGDVVEGICMVEAA